MDFARKQLEKYGWTDGKGLGKHENGISQALKPKLKRSMTGIGHDAAADFTEHWWSALYDKAASNIEVKDIDGSTKKIKAKDDTGFEITNSTWKLKKKQKSSDEKPQEQYQDFFVRTAVLGSGGSRTERVKESESEDEEVERNVFKMTDEELFAACEGRTAHKGARHGLKALGKLARIEQQEQLLLQQSKFNGYSHAKKHKKTEIEKEDADNTRTNSEEETQTKKKKRKKRECSEEETCYNVESITNECQDTSVVKKKNKNKSCKSENKDTDTMAEDAQSLSENLEEENSGDTILENEKENGRKIKKSKKVSSESEASLTGNDIEKSKKKKNPVDIEGSENDSENENKVEVISNRDIYRKDKKKKRKET